MIIGHNTLSQKIKSNKEKEILYRGWQWWCKNAAANHNIYYNVHKNDFSTGTCKYVNDMAFETQFINLRKFFFFFTKTLSFIRVYVDV